METLKYSLTNCMEWQSNVRECVSICCWPVDFFDCSSVFQTATGEADNLVQSFHSKGRQLIIYSVKQ